MVNKINELLAQIEQFQPSTIAQVEEFRIRMMGKKGELTILFDEFKNVSADQKRELGQRINTLKNAAVSCIAEAKAVLEADSSGSGSASSGSAAAGGVDSDVTRPASGDTVGTRHPISLVRGQILDIFNRIGFVTADGPEIEDDWHVFGALNFPADHPARDMQDTFFIEKNPDILLRTHTSSIQVRVMQTQKPPIRVICPGRVFRNEAISYRAHCIFHQVEGLFIAEGVSFADMKQTIQYFANELFGAGTAIRMRPSYFPFTEPSAEIDVSCVLCGGKGCNVCKYTGWLEIMGAGMVDPNVLDACGIDSKVYSGFAFGMGVERVSMLKYGVKDLRLYFENDVRFLQQFTPVL